jgi:type I restriction enzyme S subunit
MKQLLPQLRFPEFKGEWEMKKLGEVAQFSKGKGISKADITEDGEFACIRYGELYTVYGETIDVIKSRTNITSKNLVFSEANDVIIPASGETQIDIATASCVLRSGIALGGDLNIIKTNKNGVYLSYYLNSSKKKDIANLAQGISVVHLYSSQLALLNLFFPSLPEQTKIASFLSSVDQKLSQLKQKKNLLEQYKKGVMQKLFSQELRFKDENGKEFPEWKKKKLSEVGKFTSGTGFSEKEQGGRFGIPFLKVSDMNLPDNKIVIKVSNNYVSEEQVKRLKYKVITENSLIFAKVGAAIFLERKRIAKNFLIDNNMMAFIPSGNIIFFYHLFNNIKLSKYAQVGALPSFNSSDIGIIKIYFPSLKEQTKIANFLSTIDEKINRIENQITQTENWKKGLLQQMFV